MSWLTGDWPALGTVCAKTAMLAVAALAGLRLGPRRAIAELRIFDFVVAVAIGAVIGRTATSVGTSFVIGLVVLATLIAVHVVLAWLRFYPTASRLMDHPVEVLVTDGEIDHRRMRRCQLTEDDLHGALRQRGFYSLAEIRFVLFESQGGFTVVPRTASGGELLTATAENGRGA
ncbi:DUF421 domain-containing protein [Amycolatopsis taiwanensis]|uniref:YetF C-terminal domain-containing protein n=1 Tax=Amycolatopsis taiwanensis TaxID=342230 RepID=A0A9W6QUS1_9PSEU|nr:YetF domain-containing protein [Amycolatopsis taiwanensis]GLY63944.1 hypothetical protein Atai01_05630 [Amycolatopsis taiwanensis]